MKKCIVIAVVLMSLVSGYVCYLDSNYRLFHLEQKAKNPNNQTDRRDYLRMVSSFNDSRMRGYKEYRERKLREIKGNRMQRQKNYKEGLAMIEERR